MPIVSRDYGAAYYVGELMSDYPIDGNGPDWNYARTLCRCLHMKCVESRNNIDTFHIFCNTVTDCDFHG